MTYFLATCYLGNVGTGRELKQDAVHEVIANNVLLLELLCFRVGHNLYAPNYLIRPGLEQMASLADTKELM